MGVLNRHFRIFFPREIWMNFVDCVRHNSWICALYIVYIQFVCTAGISTIYITLSYFIWTILYFIISYWLLNYMMDIPNTPKSSNLILAMSGIEELTGDFGWIFYSKYEVMIKDKNYQQSPEILGEKSQWHHSRGR